MEPDAWSKSGLYYLLRFGKKNEGTWTDETAEGERIPDEDDVSLVVAAPGMYEIIHEMLELDIKMPEELRAKATKVLADIVR